MCVAGHTDAQFETSTFGQVASGSACAAILWLELYAETKDPALLGNIERALSFVAESQLVNASDPDTRTCATASWRTRGAQEGRTRRRTT